MTCEISIQRLTRMIKLHVTFFMVPKVVLVVLVLVVVAVAGVVVLGGGGGGRVGVGDLQMNSLRLKNNLIH